MGFQISIYEVMVTLNKQNNSDIGMTQTENNPKKLPKARYTLKTELATRLVGNKYEQK